MQKFSASNVAVSGFRIARQSPKAIAYWALSYLVLSLVTAVLMVTMGGDAMNQMTGMSMSNPNPAEMMALYGRLAPLYLLMLLVFLGYYSIILPAIYRSVLRPRASAFGYLRLGADEARQFVVNLVLGLILFFVYLAGAVVMGIVIAASAMGGAAGAVIGIIVGFLGLLSIFVSVAVRLSLAGPQTLAEGKLRLFDSWRLTQGQFWPLLGAYVLSVLLAIVITLLGLVIVLAVAAVLGGGMQGLAGIYQPDTTSFASYFSSLMLVYTGLMSVVSALTMAITAAPPADAYRELVGAGDIEDVF